MSVLRAITGLDEGESSALIMYDEQKADLLLMDEQKGRRVAKRLNDFIYVMEKVHYGDTGAESIKAK